MTRLRLFAQARDAAGGSHEVEVQGGTLAEVLEAAVDRFGEPFAKVLETSSIWVNGESASSTRALTAGDEVAVIPPVSGG